MRLRGVRRRSERQAAAGVVEEGLDDGPMRCETCFAGTACRSKGITVQTLPLTRGYYRPTTLSLDVSDARMRMRAAGSRS